ncbi:hypothetical protein A6M14_01560 [Acinetobacter sp. Ac_877]|nr:hypothetical protein [Acinetobacter portensis]
MGVTPYSDTQQSIARSRSEHQKLRINCSNHKKVLGFELFFTGLFRWASVYDLRIDDANTASIFKRLKSPVRFTGGLAVYWM